MLIKLFSETYVMYAYVVLSTLCNVDCFVNRQSTSKDIHLCVAEIACSLKHFQVEC